MLLTRCLSSRTILIEDSVDLLLSMPLHVAVREGHLDLALALLDRGAVIDAVNHQVQKN
jgi:ankyrin repeat protein